MKKCNKAMLVYHEYDASVYQVDCLNLCDYGRNAKLLLRDNFDKCWALVEELGRDGIIIRSAICHYNPNQNMAKIPWQCVPTDIEIN